MKNNLLNWLNYVSAWIGYAGAVLTKVSQIGSTIISSITDIAIPKKSDYFNV